MGDKADKPDFQSADYAAKYPPLFKKVEDVLGGTRTMRGAGGDLSGENPYLPQFPAENDTVYKQRVATSTFDNDYEDTLDGLVGMVFGEPLSLDGVPSVMAAQLENADLAGTHYNIFAQRLLRKGIHFGACYLVTDMQQLPEAVQGKRISAAAKQRLNLRPYWQMYGANHVQDAPRYVTIRGARTLQQIVFRESLSLPDGDFGNTEVERFRVWRLPVIQLEAGQYVEAGLVEWQIWEWEERGEKGKQEQELVQVAGGPTKLKRIPVRPFIAHPDPDDPLMFDGPTLEDLADLCIKDYQKQSDFEADLHNCKPVPYASGVKDEEDGESILTKQPWGSGVLFSLNDGGAMGYADPQGNALATWQQYLKELKEKINQKALEMVVEGGAKGVATTATEQIIREQKNMSRIAEMAHGVIDCLNGGLQDWAAWLGLGEDAGGRFQSGVEDADLIMTAQDINALQTDVREGRLSRQTYWETLIRARVLKKSFDSKEELRRIKEEQAMLPAQPVQNEPPNPGQQAKGAAA